MLNLLKKELMELINKQMLLGLAGTLVLIVLMGVIMTNTVSDTLESSGELHIVDCDDTEFTRSVIASLEEDGYTVEVEYSFDSGEISMTAMEDATQGFFINEDWKEAAVISKGFTESVLEHRTAGNIDSVTALTSTTSMDMLMSESVSADAFTEKVQEMLMEEMMGEEMEFLAKLVTTTPYTAANGHIAQVDSYTLVNSLSLFDKLMPLLLFLLVVLTSQTIITAIGAEKTDKTLETLLASPVPRTQVIGAKMLAALIVSLIYAVTYGIGFLAAMLMTVSGTGETVSLGEAATEMAQLNAAMQTLELQIPFWGWLLVIVQLILTIGIALMASIILGALVQDAKGAQTASLPILICTMFPYILSMVSDIRQMEGIAQIVMYIIPFTHTFIATSCLRFHDMGLFFGGLAYQAVFLAVMTALALKLYKSDVLFIGMPKKVKKMGDVRLLTVAVLICCLLTGCQGESSTELANPAVTYELQSIPDGGWTSQTLAKTIRIHGNTISDPFTVDSLGEEYRFAGDSTCVEYHDVLSFVVTFADETLDCDDRLKEVKKIGSTEDYTDAAFTNAFTINGIGLGASREEAERAFGEPSIIDGLSYRYCDDTENEYFLLIWFDEQDRVKNLFFCDTYLEKTADKSGFEGENVIFRG